MALETESLSLNQRHFFHNFFIPLTNNIRLLDEVMKQAPVVYLAE